MARAFLSTILLLAAAVGAGAATLADVRAALQERRWADLVALGEALAAARPRGSPEWCAGRNDGAVGLMNLERWGEAAEALAEVEKACGLTGAVAANLGLVKLVQGAVLEAQRYTSEAIRLGSDNPDTFLVLAEAYAELRLWEPALGLYQAYRLRDPYRPEGYRGEVVALARLFRWTEAAESADRLAKILPPATLDREYRVAAGRAYTEAGQHGKASDLLRRLVAEGPMDTVAVLAEARLRQAQGEDDAGMLLARKAFVLGASPEDVRELLGPKGNVRWQAFLKEMEEGKVR